jgi:sugar phosphate permease
LHSIEQKHPGVVSGVLNAGNQVGGLIGVAVLELTAISKDFISGMHKTLLLAGTMFLITAILSFFIMRE